MTLSDSLLHTLCEHAQLVHPYNPENVGPCSIDLTLGGEVRPEGNGSRPFATSVNLHDEGALELHPGERLLATTAEVIRMPRDRSTAARMGLEHSFSGLVDPSFAGQLTLELKNDLRTHSILITPGMRLVQLYVESVEGTVQHSYDRVGFYQGQAGPTVSNYRVNSWYAARRSDTTKVA